MTTTTSSQFVDAGKAAAQKLHGLSNQALQGVEKLVALNLQVAKTLLAESDEHIQACFSAKTPKDFFKLQVTALQHAPQKRYAYGRQVADIIAAATAQHRAAAEAQVAELQTKFVDAAEGALKDVPGSDKSLALIKSAVQAGNDAYEGAQKASQQVSDAVAANIAKLAQTTAETPVVASEG
jgi:phasin family protein